jgi:ABC-2 type transport system ATP-binding protein
MSAPLSRPPGTGAAETRQAPHEIAPEGVRIRPDGDATIAASNPLRRPSLPAPGPEAGAPVVLAAERVTKSYARGLWPARRLEPVLRGVDLSLGRGETVGLVGENGSGKSTLMKILVGALSPDGGTVTRNGRLGYCPQEPLLYERLTCDEHFELFAHAYGLAHDVELPARAAIYSELGFARYAGTRVDRLSGGTRAKLNLGLALLADPDVLLLDEPYAGFDWDTYQRFWTIVARRRDAGRCVLIISHFVSDLERFDRVLDLRDGTLVQR